MIRLYNTLTRQKEILEPREPGHIKMYVCGPTTYNFIHLGNARPLVVFDTVRRYLMYRGYKVTYVQNFTDVDDKIINRAREDGSDALSLAEKYINEYFKDAEALAVLPADVHPRVSEHMEDIIRMIEGLITRGHAYTVDGDVYFRVSSFPGYGKLSGRSLDEMMAGARVEVDERKEEPVDFALWKAAKPGEPSWDSPWGPGRPGWHIECSVMSMKYLGETLDIHGGGADLIFPHHENEIAQSEAYTGKTFVRYWMHNGFITVNREKMSKSLGNFFLLRDILARYSGRVVRFYLLATQYRSPLDFDDSKLEEARRALERLQNCWNLLDEARARAGDAEPGERERALQEALNEQKNGFIEAMDDDFNTALALSHLFEMVRIINSYLASEGPKPEKVLTQAARVFEELAGVLGLDLRAGRAQAGQIESVVRTLLEFRAKARQEKDYATADRVRDLLARNGVVVEDGKEGSRFHWDNEPSIDGILDDVLQMRQSLRKDKNYQRADQLRQDLLNAGIIIEDTREGSQWRLKE